MSRRREGRPLRPGCGRAYVQVSMSGPKIIDRPDLHVGTTQRLRQGCQISLIARQDDLAAFSCNDHDTCVDDVRRRSTCEQTPGLARLGLRQRTYLAPGQESGELCLRSAPPCLREDRRRDRRTVALFEESAMQCPHETVTALGSDQHSGVVRVPAHEARLRCFLARNRSAAASSSAVSAPCSASQA